MSVYGINKLLFRAEHEPDFLALLKSNLEEALAQFSLTPTEQEALTRGDLKAMFDMGVHPFLLNHLPRHDLFGVTRQNYFPRIRGQEKPEI